RGRGARGDRGDEPQCGRGGHGVVPSEGSATTGREGDAPGAWPAGRRRPGVRRWRHDCAGVCGTTGTLSGSAVMRRSSILRTTGIMLLSVGAAAAVGVLVARDQMSRHQRDLFSSQTLKRFAALGYLSGTPASVGIVRLRGDVSSEGGRVG